MLKVIQFVAIELIVTAMSVMSLITMLARHFGWHPLNGGEPTITWGYIAAVLAAGYYTSMIWRFTCGNEDGPGMLSIIGGLAPQVMSAALIFIFIFGPGVLASFIPGAFLHLIMLYPTDLAQLLMFVAVFGFLTLVG